MKKIFSYAMMLVAGSLAFISCDADRDSNPTLVTPAEGTFVLNTPVYGTALVDLATSSSIELSWSQPQFTEPNAPVTAVYEVQLSSSGSFTTAYDANADDNSAADYFVLDETYSSCDVEVSAENIATALQQLNLWTEDNAVFTDGMDLSIRVRAFVQNASYEELASIVSNTVTIDALPYYVELTAADPDIWYLIGGDIADGAWGSAMPTSSFPMQTVADYEYDAKTGYGKITWTGYLAGNGFKIKHTLDSWDEQIGQGSSQGTYVKNNGGSGNIVVPAAGYYTITLDTEVLDGIEDEGDCGSALTIEAYSETPTVFTSMSISGDFNSWSDTEMSPVSTVDGVVNHDWYIVQELDGTQGIKIKETGSWDYNSGAASDDLNTELVGYGTNNGANIYPAAGTYLIIYNDITRYYRFILQ